jgi:ATP-dependent RNA helicase DeaD
MDNLFEKLELKESLVQGLIRYGFTEPTEIQEKVIPLAIQNKDIIGQSQTGTGKTLAYLLPAFQKIDINKREMQVLILAPTHELVMQIYNEVNTLAKNSELPVTAASIIGDVNITRQIERLKEKPHIIVGSSGRVLELIKKKKISAHTIKTIIIDEADKLLDRYNIDNVKAIIKTTLKERQLMMFSATISQKTVDIAQEIMKTPELIRVEDKTDISPNITHYYFVCEQRDKIEVLRKLIHAVNPEKALIFINKSDDIAITAAKLSYHKLKAEGIHGTDIKEDRKKALEDFRRGKIQFLVASDIAARGLDISGVTHVFNLEMPEDPRDYFHRVGRTGRAGNTGTALSIITEREEELVKKLRNTQKLDIQRKDIYRGKIVDIH